MSALSPLLARPGAVAGSGADAAVAWHYGDPAAEQRALVDGRAVVDQSHLGVVTVTGPDRLTWLHSLTTQDLMALEPGQSTETMVLSPQGRIEHVAGVVDNGETTFLITESAPTLTEFLQRMVFTLRVEVADATAQWACLGEPLRTPAAAGEPVTWVDPWPGIVPGGTTYVADPHAVHPGTSRPWRLVLVPREDLEQAVDERIEAGWTLAGTWASEALRIAAHRPRCATDVDAVALPHEYDWLRTAVHLHKGCYRGQETVAKVHNVGRPPRRLTLVHLDGSEHLLPEHGDAVTVDGTAVGTITSASRHHQDGPLALAVLKRSVDPTVTLTVTHGDASISASQDVIVRPEGTSADRPDRPGPTMKGLLMGKGCDADGGDMPTQP